MIDAKGLDDPIHMHPLDFIPFQTSAAKKGKDHVTFNRKCGVLNRRDDERENIDLYIIIRRSGERETKRKKKTRLKIYK